jgi:hypothetical protein
VIENRNLEVGTRLVATYKKQAYVCTVEAGESEGEVAFVLEDGKRYKSPSAAGSAVMGGEAVNGWCFWSLEGEAAAPSTEAKPEKPKSGKGKRTIYRIPPGNLAEGKSKWFCVACMKSFVIEGSDAPAACPEGHPMEDLHTEEVAS